ncbi:uncharacterized protein LOC141536868 [Cotesia typhae]|uniref:uncharacterized protein LOC141536868 n=1 Tax=Cotesia typhae TaxID=2053667 RepID=UPI003D68512C
MENKEIEEARRQLEEDRRQIEHQRSVVKRDQQEILMESQRIAEIKQQFEKQHKEQSEVDREITNKVLKLQEMQLELNKILISIKTQTGNSASIVESGNNSMQIMTGGVGSLNTYKAEENWNLWSERFEHYVVANGISDSRKKSTFLSLIGYETYALLHDLYSP